MYKTDTPATLALLVCSSQCCRKKLTLDVLLDFLGGNLPPEPKMWSTAPPWSEWLAHIELFVNDLDIHLVEDFMKETGVNAESIKKLYFSLPDVLQCSEYVPLLTDD